MLRRVLPLGLPFALLAAGCVPTDQPDTRLVQPSRFDTSAVPQPKLQQVSYTPGTPETARRVAEVGQKVVLANPQVGMRPIFQTTGTPQPEVFHKGTGQVVISEGLVKQCRTDGELAAVLALELGKMVAER
ncbi:MAG TPA: M48 family metalloprotease, partial [Gemmataceae bacterium]|nr:M48 family metalloprotease [Gemmataceae bacterium]